MVAAPRRANASSAALFPAPMPPVIAIATGRLVLALVASGFGGGDLVVRGRIHLVARAHSLALDGLLGRGGRLERRILLGSGDRSG
jgi:hypothetical protein